MTVSKRVALATCGVAAIAGLSVAIGAAPAGAAAVTPASGCSATANVQNQWGSGATGGEIVVVTVLNTSASTSTTWTVSWTLAAGQQLASIWNAGVSTSGSAVTATNLPYNGVLAPGESTDFGVRLTGTGPVPTMSCVSDAPTPNTSTVTVTQDDNGTTVVLLVGQTLVVSLDADFRPVTMSGTGLKQLSASGGYPTGNPLTAVYRAVAPGSADLDTVTDYPCLHTTPPCALPQMLWTVHVSVISGM